ncbi:SMAD/FHA domain-containing protein [Podospora fimiseda]|uniref:SMAD/FHA domain-containing protein n=1 Tax=Podospora fimiseda TaxID=252190 RepID=A0AAN7H237_9PEZI|nr:SMAD/FHA domain-containing protein [Podospora fimiseda]
MGDDSYKSAESASRRSRHDDDDIKRRRRHDDSASKGRRDRSRDRDRERERKKEREHRRRSRSPDPRPPRSRSRERERQRDRDEHRDRDRGSKRSRSRERDSTRSSHRQRDKNDRSDRSDKRYDDRYDTKSDAKRGLVKRGGPLPSQDDSFAVVNGEEPMKPVEKPNYGTSGALAAASNSVIQADGTTITLKYHEPPEARKPSPRDEWKLFIFKGQDIVDTIDLNARSCWLVGREVAVVDLPAEHPSISKQHAVIQFRYTEKRNEFGDKIGRVKPYLIDLESANGTLLNGEKVPESRYLELRNKDMVRFGSSTREYVFMLAPKK